MGAELSPSKDGLGPIAPIPDTTGYPSCHQAFSWLPEDHKPLSHVRKTTSEPANETEVVKSKELAKWLKRVTQHREESRLQERFGG